MNQMRRELTVASSERGVVLDLTQPRGGGAGSRGGSLLTLLRLEPNACPRRLPKDLELWKKLQKAHQGTDSGDPLLGHGPRKALDAS